MLRDSLLTGLKLWGARRIERRTLWQATAGVTVCVLLSAWHIYAGAVIVLVAGVVYGRSRLQQARERQPIRRGRGWWFGGQLLRLAPFTEGGGVTSEEAKAAGLPEAELVLWIVAIDGAGQPWIKAQERPGPTLTATVTGTIDSGADPFLEAQRLALSDAGVSLSAIEVVGWGTDLSVGEVRRVVVVVGQTTAGTDALADRSNGALVRNQLVEVHPDSFARILTTVGPGAWEAAAVRGMVAALEMVYPNGGALLETLVEDQWRNRIMFDRVEALTATAAERERKQAIERRPPDSARALVLKAVDGVVRPVDERLSLANRRRGRSRRPSRSLSWESTNRIIPNRY